MPEKKRRLKMPPQETGMEQVAKVRRDEGVATRS
jgi:hypothetical protein